MAEIVLGVGYKKTVRTIVELVDEQITKKEGVPGRVCTWTNSSNIEARRSDLEGDFDSYDVRVTRARTDESALQSFAQAHPEDVFVKQEDGSWRVAIPPPGKAFREEQLELVDELTKIIRLPEVWRAEGFDFQDQIINVEKLFQAMIKYRASDVHLTAGLKPIFRIDNDARFSDIMQAFSGTQIRTLIRRTAPPGFYDEFEEFLQTSYSYHQAGMGYSRVSAFMKNGAPHCTFRYLPEAIPSFEELNVPAQQMQTIADTPRGLILITGMTGSGKTTTMAALLDWINTHKALHILTIENPVEFVHSNKKSIVSQRNIGTDVRSFSEAVTGALRHDPDVVLIGEMRDPDTIRAAINAAATGHLVISTLHSNTSYEVINRIVSFFDPIERDLVRLQLRDCLQGVICQRLVPKTGGGRIPALEFLFNDIKPINDAILKGDTDAIRVGMQQTISHSMLFEQYLLKMFKEGVIALEDARQQATDVSVFDQMRMGTYSVPRLDSIKGG
ncbi:MAG: PilT/PilU family type 4a pilus ATPase [Candidatus Hydrogenedens sp.]|jgi:twitching motility protein PilT|nr:PilT/PilU family type 4a pilus ATPase [Candidatus Hydrogenedens sp.]